MGCDGSTSPPETASGLYILQTINGRPLPAYTSAGQADTSFVLSATLILDDAGNALRAERWRYVYQPNGSDEGTFTAHVKYRINGDNITVGTFTPCPPLSICEGNKVGKITGTSLTLAYEDPTAPTFLYRRALTN